MPVVKLASLDPSLREYLLYTLLSICATLGTTVKLPAALRSTKLSPADWEAHGSALGKAETTRFDLSPLLAATYQAIAENSATAARAQEESSTRARS